MEHKPLLSVWMLTYNQENYISESINSVLTQKTNFPYILHLGEDCSTDNTRNICISYKNKNPDSIDLHLNDQNDIVKNAKTIYEACFNSGAKYIAMLEGDDYWTDPYKLQKQVDFLEGNKDFTICGHKTKMLFEKDANKEQIEGADEGIYTIEDLTKNNFIPTSSVVFRKEYIKELPNWFLEVPVGDWALFLLSAQHGKIKMYNDVMSVHRIHSGGIWTKNEVKTDWPLKRKTLIRSLDILKDKFDPNINNLLTKTYFSFVFQLLGYYIKHKDYENFTASYELVAENENFNKNDVNNFFSTIAIQYEQLSEEIEKKNKIISDIKNSNSYRIGNKVVNIFKNPFLK